jgi:ADP-L-glycero-D-manno-heptose 6-epimerase
MKCLVTGGTGFIGHHLAVELLKKDHQVLVTGSCPERVPKGAKFLPHNLNGIDFKSLEGVDVVFHQSANNNTLDNDYEQMIYSNFYAACDLFLATLHYSNCKQFVYASSTAVYGNQPTPYKENQKTGPLNFMEYLNLDLMIMQLNLENDII